MLRYVAFAWNNQDPAKRTTADLLKSRLTTKPDPWRLVLNRPGLAVCCKQIGTELDEIHTLENGNGVALGQLFPSDSNPDDGARPAPTAKYQVASGIKQLLHSHWGRYIAFCFDPRSQTVSILRDPSGAALCFKATLEGVDVYFCRLADFESLSSRRLTLNLQYVGAFLLLGSPMNGETAVNEISEVLPGTLIEYAGPRSTSGFLWNPLEIATTDVIDDVHIAIRSTREVVRACIHSWASRFDKIVVQLSGGLDSSIIVSCLKDAPNRPRVVCLNWYSDGSDSDERRFARAAASSAGFELIERERNPHFRLDALLNLPRTPYPCSCIGYLDTGATEREICEYVGSTALFYGVGGDWLFHMQGEIPEAADYAYRHGLGSAFVTRVIDSARLHRLSVWKVAGEALRYGLLKRPWNPSQRDQEGCCQIMLPRIKDMLNNDAHLRHPLFRERTDIPPGKMGQVYAITAGTVTRYNPLERIDDPYRLSPLCSQPLMELSLRIPTDILTLGGVDRAIARRAFANELPQSIVTRRTKGGVEEHIKEILSYNVSVVKELLLDGVLVAEGFLDRARLETALTHRPGRETGYPSEIWSYLIVESWYRSWCHSAQRAAA